MHLNLPTLLTLLRVALIPLLFLLATLPAPELHPWAAAVFGLATATDWLDGYLARRLNQTTAFGAFLDPVADKLIVAVALILIVIQHPTVWMGLAAAIIIGREITVSALREWMAEVGANATMAVSWLGKLKTTAQMLALFFLLLQVPIFGLSSLLTGQILLIIAVVLTLWSMCDYLMRAWPVLRAS